MCTFKTERSHKSPTIKTARVELAAWIVEELCGGSKPIGGRVVTGSIINSNIFVEICYGIQ